jgi:hypothetical protein
VKICPLIKIVPFVVSLVLLNGCATLSSNTVKGPKTVVAVSMFKNSTFQPGLEDRFTNQLMEDLMADGRIKLSNLSDAPQFTIEGTIKRYNRTISSVDGNDNVIQYQLSIVVDVRIIDAKTRKLIVAHNDIQSSTTYVPNRDNIDYEKESEAQERLLEDLSDEVIYNLMDKKRSK